MPARLGTDEAGKCRNLWIVRKSKETGQTLAAVQTLVDF